jgi:uncharacterized protein DUF1566
VKTRIGFLFLLAAVLLAQLRLWAQSGATLQITTDLDCSWKLDGKPQGILKAEDSAVIPVSFGKHNISAFSDDVQVAFNADVTVNQTGQQSVEIKLIKTELTVTTDLDCSWKLDGDSQGELKAGDSTSIPVSLGKHNVYAIAKGGMAVFDTAVNASQDTQPRVDIKLKETELDRQSAWLDERTGLMWARESNIGDITWQEATDYCENTGLGNHHNWRLPTIDELRFVYSHEELRHSSPEELQSSQELYQKFYACCENSHLLVHDSRRVWSSNKDEKTAEAFSIEGGEKQISIKQDDGHNVRALCVRDSGE